MKLWIIDKQINIAALKISRQDYVINFTSQIIKSGQELDYSIEYNDLRKVIKDKYIQFVAELGNLRINNKTIKEWFVMEDTSLWWFNKITRKDSFGDSLFDDICKAILVNKVVTEKKVTSVIILSDSTLLNIIWANRKKSLLLFIIEKNIERIKRLLVTIWVKYRYFQGNQYSAPIKYLFWTYYPLNWTKDINNNYSDRFFRGLPSELKNSGYLVFLTYANKMQSSNDVPFFCIQKYLTIKEILSLFFDIRNILNYFIIRKNLFKNCVFEGVNLSVVYEYYLREALLVDNYHYSLMIRSIKKIFKETNPEIVITGGEFGHPSRSVFTVAKKEGAITVWLQHASISRQKLWFYNADSEMFDNDRKMSSDFVCQIPIADWYIVWGVHSKQLLSSYGYPEERIVVLGNPRYDLFDKKRFDTKQELTDIVFVPSIDKAEVEIFSDLAKEIKHSFPDKNIILKLHPRYKILLDKDVLKMLSEVEKAEVIVNADNIEKYYNSSVILVCGVSTVGIEAAYFGVKVITYLSKYHNRFTPDWLEKGTYSCSLEKVIEMIKNYQNIPVLNWQQYYLPPGDSQTQVINFLQTLSA